MSVIATMIARVTDWRTLQQINDQILIAYAREAGATRYRVFRNVYDAAQLLLIAEYPSYDALRRMAERADAKIMDLIEDGLADDRIWEPVDCQSIG